MKTNYFFEMSFLFCTFAENFKPFIMKELVHIDPEQTSIKMHNAITAGRYDYSSEMLDILFMTLALIDENNPSQREFTIYVNDMKAITGRTYNYQQLRDSTESIGSRMFEIETPDSLTQLWLFSYVRYHLNKGCFTVKINEDALPFFYELKREFTMLNLKAVLSCSSKYAKRLYAIACQWRKVGFKEYTIEDLKYMLDLKNPKTGEEQYTNITDFKKKVLDIALKQINEFTDVKLSYRLEKRGRTFQRIALYIDRREAKQLELDIDFSKTIEQNKIEAIRKQFLKAVISCGISEAYAELIVQHSTINEFEAVKAETLDKMRKGEIKTEAHRYIVGIYQKKGILPAKGEKARTSADGALVAQIAETIAKGKTKK